MPVPTYTTVDEVSGSLLLVTRDLLREDISGSITRAEGVIDAMMQKTGRGSSPDFTFDEAKHGIIKDTAMALSGYDLISADTETFASNSAAGLLADLLWAKVNRNLVMLLDKNVQKWLTEI